MRMLIGAIGFLALLFAGSEFSRYMCNLLGTDWDQLPGRLIACVAYTPFAAWTGYIKTSSVRTTVWVLVCGWATFLLSWIAWTTLAALGFVAAPQPGVNSWSFGRIAVQCVSFAAAMAVADLLVPRRYDEPNGGEAAAAE